MPWRDGKTRWTTTSPELHSGSTGASTPARKARSQMWSGSSATPMPSMAARSRMRKSLQPMIGRCEISVVLPSLSTRRQTSVACCSFIDSVGISLRFSMVTSSKRVSRVGLAASLWRTSPNLRMIS
ncbi:hypothetical protein D3C71_1883400 [compost metagenome]